MSTLQRRIAREFCVRQTRSAEIELIGTNCVGREKIVRARRADNVVLIDAIAADSDRADGHAVIFAPKTRRSAWTWRYPNQTQESRDANKKGWCALFALRRPS